MEIPLHFGDRLITLQVPSAHVADFITPRKIDPSAQNDQVVKTAIERVAPQLHPQILDRSVGVLLPDGTRDLPLQEILPLLLPALKAARKILFFICTGSHRAETTANKEIIAGLQNETARADIENYEIICHDCRKGPFRSSGRTTRGTDIKYHARLDALDCFVALSEIKHHYFAGYSNPIKNVVPGLCAFETIEQNHSLTFDESSRAGVHPWHSDLARRSNPLAADLLEAFTQIIQDRPIWAMTTISNQGAVQWAEFGVPEEACSMAFDQVDQWNAHTVRPVSYMIVSPGGLPNDIDLYIAQRALELTTSVLRNEGQLLFAAACPNGVGTKRTYEQFHKPLKQPLEIIEPVNQANYKLFSHKPVRLARLIRRLSKIYMTSEIPRDEIEKIHMTPCANPQHLIESWIQKDPSAEILTVDGANKLLLNLTG